MEQQGSLVIILYGPRQAGKTTLMQEVLEGKEEAIKSQTPAEMVARRVINKNVEVLNSSQVVAVSEEKVESSEASLKDFPEWEKVFQKAA